MMKKFTIAVMVFLILFSTAYLFLCLHKKKDVETTLHLFYDGFIARDYANAYTFFDVKFRSDLSESEKQGRIANLLIMDRNWYGEIKRIKISTVFWSGKNSRYAFVKVDVGSNEAVTDKIKLKQINKEWVISKFDSGITLHLP
ncbi:hypothetical protein [Paenibacillus sp. HB172176]|uniref:hypothetical protein n=1 Tax=Paenibacillus sp. HB172176 TaxID=2493690 RepID=UPI00143A93EA|nr:hypothetical protein [Paenibacillus sp. HB172176]